jgi:hypothetical protein
MRRGYVALFWFVFASFGLMWAVPATDLPETAYDESESLPFETSSVLSLRVCETVAEASAKSRRTSLLPVSCLRSLKEGRLGHGTGSAYPVCDSLTVLDEPLRC